MDQPWRVRTKLIQGPPGPNQRISGSGSWTPGTVTAGGYVTTTVTVTGAVVGQTATAGFSNTLQAGMTITAFVSAANTVTVQINNFSASPVGLSSGTVWADVLVH